MGQERGQGGKKKKAGGGGGGGKRGGGSEHWHAMLDPRHIRFAHSRISPRFSGCGRRVEGTLEEIRSGKASVEDLPTITVIEGPKMEQSGGGGLRCWYFSLNNRRLWVLKQLREEGLLKDDVARVRVRMPKPNEVDRYTVDRCSLAAKFMRDRQPAGSAQPQVSKAQETEEEEDASQGEGG